MFFLSKCICPNCGDMTSEFESILKQPVDVVVCKACKEIYDRLDNLIDIVSMDNISKIHRRGING